MSEENKVVKERLGDRTEGLVHIDTKFMCNNIDYAKDTIIEASAGTGKTYTLQSIVLKLLLEKTIDSVKNLLLVTYTEKAAGELKDRIRKVLEEAGCLPSDFDEVTICTIHSFCRSLLTEYAFENRVPMQVEIGGSDKDLIHRAVRTALFGDDFKARYGESYDAYMKVAGLTTTDDLVAAAENELKDSVRLGQSPCDPNDICNDVRRNLQKAVKATSFNFDDLAVHGGDKGFLPACELVETKIGDLSSKDFLTLFDAVSSIAELSIKHGNTYEKLNPRVKVDGEWTRLYEIRPDLRRFAETAQNAREVLLMHFISDLAFIAWPVFTRLKDEVAALTFDDLVNRAHDVIVAESKAGKKSALLKSIRRKYRIALVDEFQDTDSKQWAIFKSIFSDKVNKIDDGPNPMQGALLVVGDPKQAIYSFRGADVGAYLAARGEITKDNATARHSLDKTYRSSPGLVAAFNQIFGDNGGADPSWFEGMEEGGECIIYEGVKSPDGKNKFDGIDYHSEFGEPVELLESIPEDKPPKTPSSTNSGYGNKTRCLPEFLRNAAQEIKRLVSLEYAYTTVDKDTGDKEPHSFSYRDMCILVRGHADADKAREILAAANIPFSIYKEQGIYASAEAEALLALFDFLSVPSRRGRLEALLLTPLFGYSPDQLEVRRKQEDREFSRRLDIWQELVSKKEWSKLFESVMNDTLLAHPCKDDPDFDRSWAATRQILDKLLECVGRKAQTIDEFADVLRSWRQDDKRAGEDGALRRKESEADRVQIMTMHVSKGLEFPVVFVAWGFGPLAYKVESDKQQAAIREEKRLLYVALTRAEHKLYLPWSQWAQHRRITGTDKKTKEKIEVCETGIGSVGSALLIQESNPNSGFLAHGIRALFKSDDAAKAAVIRVSKRAKTAESAIKDKANAETEEETKVEGTDNGAAVGINVYELDAKALTRQKIDNDSYSSVHRKAKQSAEPEGDSRNDENNDDVASLKKEKTLLPRNNISGDVFHELMETLCNTDDSDGKTPGFCTVGKAKKFADVAKDERFLNLIRKTMRKHQLPSQKGAEDETTELVLARMAWRALKIPITIGGKKFILKEIKASNRRAELEFVVNRANVLGDDGVTDDGAAGVRALPDPQSESTFNGKIDLLVRPYGLGGPVYILDWKTNSLPSYGMETLGRAMTASDYHLQYQFYSQAVRYWLRGAELGGVAYMFVRAGEKSESLEGDAGVFVADAAAISQESCRAAIKNALK